MIKDDKMATIERTTLATQSIKRMIELENISLICYIDDKVDVNSLKEEYIGLLTSIYTRGEKPEELDFVDWSLPRPQFLSKINEEWEILTALEKKENYRKLSIYAKDSNSIPALTIESILGDKVKLFSPKEWEEDEYNLLKNLKEGEKILCLFDIEFERDAKPESGRDGLDLAKHLLDSEQNDNYICGVFSHLFSIEDEDDRRSQFSQEKNLPKNKFYTISKERYSYDPKISAFAEGIKNLILLPHVEFLKEQSIKSFEKSFQESSTRMQNISPKTFNQIVQKSSFKEGVWEVNTLHRLFNIISKEENLNHISIPANKQIYIDRIKNIRNIDEVETGYKYDDKNQQLLDIRNSELYIKGSIVNKLHFPICNGDIFDINGKQFILLVQPCNLAIRTNQGKFGKRNFDYKNAILIPLRIKSISDFRQSVSNEKIEYPNFNNEVKYADFPNFKSVSLDLIDLVVFNEDGIASIDMNKETLNNDLIHEPWLNRYTYIHQEFKKFEKGIINFNNIKNTFDIKNNDPDYNSLKTFIFAPECLKDLRINGPDIYDYTSRIFTFKIRRICHYKSPFSDELLQKFMQYLSRNALDHDYTLT